MRRLTVWLTVYLALAGAIVYVTRQFYMRQIDTLQAEIEKAQQETQAARNAVRMADEAARQAQAQNEDTLAQVQTERAHIAQESQVRNAQLHELTAEVSQLRQKLQAAPAPQTLPECVGQLELCQTLVSRLDAQAFLLHAEIESAAQTHALDVRLLTSNTLELVSCRTQVTMRDAQIKALERDLSLRTMQNVALYQSLGTQNRKLWAVAVGAFAAGAIVGLIAQQ